MNKKRLIAVKIYFDRARMYLGYINFFILNIVLINSIENEVLKSYINDYKLVIIPLLFIIYAITLIFIGYLDTKLGLRQEEMRNNTAVNPIMQDLIRKIDEIHLEIAKKSNEEKEEATKLGPPIS
jgi:hypothetical protein